MNKNIMPYLVKNRIQRSMSLGTVESNATGFLKINVYRHVERTPVANAFVLVSKLVILGYYKESGSGYYLATTLLMKMAQFLPLNSLSLPVKMKCIM